MAFGGVFEAVTKLWKENEAPKVANINIGLGHTVSVLAASVFLAASMGVTTTQVFTNTVTCHGGGSFSDAHMNHLCGSFTHWRKRSTYGHKDFHTAYFAWYKYTPLLLGVFGACYCFTISLWARLEGQRMQHLTGRDLDGLVDKEKRREVAESYVEYITYCLEGPDYLSNYRLIKVINLTLMALQATILANLMQFEHSTNNLFDVPYWLGQLTTTWEERRDTLKNEVFPREFSCRMTKGGLTGTIERLDGICFNILAHLYEMSCLLGFWYLIILGILQLFDYLILGLSTWSFRRIRNRDGLDVHCLKEMPSHQIFMYLLVKKNVDSMLFNEILDVLAEKFHGA